MNYKRILISLVLAVLATHGAFAADPLAPSLKFLDPVSLDMPDFRPVGFYRAVPDSQGVLKDGIGGSQFVRGWFLQMEPTLPRLLKLREKLDQDVGVYGETVREQGQEVLSSKKETFGASLRRLNDATGGEFFRLLDQYRREMQKVNRARERHKIAQDEAESAGFGLNAELGAEKECLLLLEKSKVQAERGAIERKLKQSREWIDSAEQAISAALDGPTSLASYLGEKTESAAKAVLIELIYSSEQARLLELAAKIDAIDTELKNNQCQVPKDRLSAARSTLQGKLRSVVVGYGEILNHRANAWSVIDQLAALEKGKGQGRITFFQQLQTYNSQVNLMGKTVFDRVATYQDFLAKGPIANGDFIFELVRNDLAIVASEKRDPTGNWTNGAQKLQKYLADYTRWHHAETKRVGHILEGLRAGKHLHFVDLMISDASRQLGATVQLQDIIQ